MFSRSRVPYLGVIHFFDHDVPLFNWALNQHYQDVAVRAAAQAYAVCYRATGSASNCANEAQQLLQLDVSLIQEEQYDTVSGNARIMVPNTFPVMSLSQVIASGPGVAPTTQYVYQNEGYQYCDRYDYQTGLPVGPACTEDPCADASCTDSSGRWTEITFTNGDKIRKRYGVVYGVNEGVLLEEQRISAQGAIMRHVLHSYLDGANMTVQAFNRRVGWAFTPDPIMGLESPGFHRNQGVGRVLHSGSGRLRQCHLVLLRCVRASDQSP